MIKITGANGFVGTNLCQYLKKESIPFKKLSRHQINQGITGLTSSDTIIHLAGVIRHPIPRSIYQANICLTHKLLKLAKRAKVKKLVFISSARVINNYHDPYTFSKLQAEEAVKASGLPFIILRPSFIYGPGDRKNMKWLINLVKFSPLIPLPHKSLKRQPLYVSDLVKLIVKVSNSKKKNKTINVIGNKTVSISDLIKLIIKQSQLKCITFNLPVKLMRNELFPQSKWWRDWQIQPTPLSQGIKKTIELQ